MRIRMLLSALAVAILLCAASAFAALPEVTRVSEDLRGSTHAMIFGEGFEDGQTKVSALINNRTWNTNQAAAALKAGVVWETGREPLAGAQQWSVKQARTNVVLVGVGLPLTATPAVFWVSTPQGTSRGWVVNRPRPWWLGTDRAAPGERVRVFGRNLAGAGTNSPPLVLLKASDGAIHTCAFAGRGLDGNITDPVSSTYETSFTVPKDLAPGRYAVWVHAGIGEQYGWGKPLELDVAVPPPAPTLRVNAAEQGVRADGVSDDTEALAKAIRQADQAGGGTVVLPPGTLIVSNTVIVPARVSLMGAGMHATIFRVNPAKPLGNATDLFLPPDKAPPQKRVPRSSNSNKILMWVQTESRFSDFGLDLDSLGTSGCGLMIENGKAEATDLVFERLSSIRHPREQSLSVDGKWMEGVHSAWAFSSTRRVIVRHCQDFGVNGAYGTKARYARSERNFNGHYGANQMERCLIEENTIRDIYGRRGFCGGGQYVGMFRNTVGETWLMGGGGEHYLRESGGAKLHKVIASEPTTIQPENPPPGGKTGWYFVDDYTVVVVAGRGFGQVRRVLSFTNGVYQLDEPWDVAPDTGSQILLGKLQCRSLFVGNISAGGVNSLSLYVGNVEQVVAGHDNRYAGMLMMHEHYEPGSACHFNEIRDSKIIGGDGAESLAMIYFTDKKPERVPYPIWMGCEWRDNTFEDNAFYAYGGSSWGDRRWIEFSSQGALMIHTSNRGLVLDHTFQWAHLVTGNTIRRARGGSGIFVGPETSNIYVVNNHCVDCATPVSHYGKDRYEQNNN